MVTDSERDGVGGHLMLNLCGLFHNSLKGKCTWFSEVGGGVGDGGGNGYYLVMEVMEEVVE